MPSFGIVAFKNQCLAILENLGPEGIIVTKRGRPIARVLPIHDQPGADIGRLGDLLQIHGDILTSDVAWEADDQP